MSRRTERVASAIREVISTAILFELSDPRVKGVTVLGAEVSGDLRHAKIFVSLMGDARQTSLAMHGLRSARGYLQRKVADRLDIRYTPVLEFVEDDGVKRSLEMSALLRDVVPEEAEPAAETADAAAAEDDEWDEADSDEDDADEDAEDDADESAEPTEPTGRAEGKSAS